MKSTNLKNEIAEYLKSNIQFALATFGEYPWIATMYYGVDDDLNIFFLTKPSTIHAQGLYKNPQVSAVIANSPQDPQSKKVGMQIYGFAEELKDKEELNKAFMIWGGVLGITDFDTYSYEGIKSGKLSYRLYKLTPKKIKYYNENIWEEGKEQTIEL